MVRSAIQSNLISSSSLVVHVTPSTLHAYVLGISFEEAIIHINCLCKDNLATKTVFVSSCSVMATCMHASVHNFTGVTMVVLVRGDLVVVHEVLPLLPLAAGNGAVQDQRHEKEE